MVSNSFSVRLEEKHGVQREGKHAKHMRHSAKARPTSRFCCLRGWHHGQSCKIHSHNTSTNAEPLLIHYVAPKKKQSPVRVMQEQLRGLWCPASRGHPVCRLMIEPTYRQADVVFDMDVLNESQQEKVSFKGSVCMKHGLRRRSLQGSMPVHEPNTNNPSQQGARKNQIKIIERDATNLDYTDKGGGAH